ncbi:MAG: SH3 domain-containing protein [Chloroflexota bacterium]
MVRPTPSATPADEAPPTPSPTTRASADETMPPLLVASIVGALGHGGEGGPGPGTTGGSGGPRGGPADVPTGPSRDGKSGGGKAWGPLAAVLSIVGLNGPIFPSLGLAPTLVTTTGAVATAMAFGLFGRRRREDELSDDVLARAAAAGVAIAPNRLVGASAGSGVPPSGIASAGAGVATDARPAPEPLEPSANEALMPRWRRPSLLQARKFDPVRDASGSSPRLTFGEGLVGPLAGRERKVIRYRVVRLLDSPDELRGSEIGYLDQGDEVQLLEKYGAYWLVLSPDGQQGWLHKMVLGEIVDGDEPPPVDAPVATMPTVADSWTMGESDIDADVFDAYLESRRRSA